MIPPQLTTAEAGSKEQCQKVPDVTTMWINLKNKEFQRCNPQAERDKVLDLLEKIPTYPSDLGDMV